ncbi:MAG TPA: hypothetical protein VNA04_06590 [Thermoanaerobaculia bacterium]|nr:hypothetical protein [Thermoanaerobaculia bacterium]
MTDPVLALVLILAFLVAAAAVRYFRTLESDFWGASRNPLLAGAIAGVLVRFAAGEQALQVTALAVMLTLAALYSRLTGEESEPADGMLLGALSGAAASVALVVDGDQPLRAFAECLLAGAVAGYGITFAALHVAEKTRQILWDVVTAAAAMGAAWTPALLVRLGVPDRRIALGTAALVPLVVIGAVLRQWPDVRAELRHEASLGFIDDEDVRPTAHPILRLGRGGWTDAGAHREFVRIANRIALRKRQQRARPDLRARLYQLEVMKLRMQLHQMSRIEHAQSAGAAGEGQGASDTMRTSE